MYKKSKIIYISNISTFKQINFYKKRLCDCIASGQDAKRIGMYKKNLHFK